jgi:hypothetical protein
MGAILDKNSCATSQNCGVITTVATLYQAQTKNGDQAKSQHQQTKLNNYGVL